MSFVGLLDPKIKAALDVEREGYVNALAHAQSCRDKNRKGSLDSNYWKHVAICIERQK